MRRDRNQVVCSLRPRTTVVLDKVVLLTPRYNLMRLFMLYLWRDNTLCLILLHTVKISTYLTCRVEGGVHVFEVCKMTS